MLARRKRLMLGYGTLGLVLTLAATVLVIRSRGPAEAYEAGEDIEGITSALARDLPEDYSRVTFEDVTEASGLASFSHFGGERSTQLPEDMGSGAAWGDYDDDGYPDLFLCNIKGPLTVLTASDASATNRLFHNEGDGTFEDVTEKSGVGAAMMSMGAAWADWSGDGALDLVVTSYSELKLYRNQRDGTFVDVTDSAGLQGHQGFWTGASWGDYDRDGDLDLYVSGYVQYTFDPDDAGRGTRQYQAVVPYTLNPSSYSPERNLLLRNEGGETFTEVAAEAGVVNAEGRSLAASWCDFDEDGELDLYVANDVSDNVMYKNLGDGTFEDVSHAAWVADYRGAMGIAVADWDGDSDQDVFVTHWIAQENALYSNMKVAFGGSPVDPGEMRFMDVADMVGLGQIALDYVGWGTFFFDYDNDGRPDLFVANGSTFQDEANPGRLATMTSSLFWNAGPQRGFFDVAAVASAALRVARVSRGAAPADFDRDGDLDLVLVNHGEQPLLLRNDGGNQNHWLTVDAPPGSKVSIQVGDTVQTIQVASQASYLSQSPFEAHFGLGTADSVDRVTVIFPNGERLERRSVPANERITLEETP